MKKQKKKTTADARGTKKSAGKTAKKTVKKALKKTAVKTAKKTAKISLVKAERKKIREKRAVRKISELDAGESLRKHLVSHRRQIIREAKDEIAKFIKGETKQLVDTALDDGDWSLVDLSEDLNLRKLSAHKETLNKIDEALRKLNEGTYGICEDCGTDIGEARLKVIPFAIYCIDCKEKRERMEEFERREEY